MRYRFLWTTVDAISARLRTLQSARRTAADFAPDLMWWTASAPGIAMSHRLEAIPGIGSITASAIAATVTDAALFKSGRQLAAWIGLVPRQNSSGVKDRLGRISKQATLISAGFSSSGRTRFSASAGTAKGRRRVGLPSFWRRSRTTSSLLLWQPRWRGSSGR